MLQWVLFWSSDAWLMPSGKFAMAEKASACRVMPRYCFVKKETDSYGFTFFQKQRVFTDFYCNLSTAKSKLCKFEDRLETPGDGLIRDQHFLPKACFFNAENFLPPWFPDQQLDSWGIQWARSGRWLDMFWKQKLIQLYIFAAENLCCSLIESRPMLQAWKFLP